MSAAPPWSVINAIETGQCSITRRIEIYEADGTTPWYPSSDETLIKRLVEGSVSVDATRPERRTLDLTLLNDDNLLRPDPNSGFWYDKVIKTFRGINYSVPLQAPSITVVEDAGSYGAQRMQTILKSMGFTRTFIDMTSATVPTDVIISYTQTAATAKATMLADQYAAGRSVLTISNANTEAQVPLIATGSAVGGTTTWGVSDPGHDTPVAGEWITGAAPGTAAGYAVSAVAAGAVTVAVWSSGGGPATITAILQTNSNGGRWANLQLPSVETTALKTILSALILWLQDYTPTADWEVQLGEFVIDSLNDQQFPYQIKLSCRDYMKRMINSKLSQDETFIAGTSISDLVIALARNSGITNQINIPNLGRYLEVDLSYTRKTPRADIAIAAMNGIGYDLFFNNLGQLSISALPDPYLDPTTHNFLTGPSGNLVSAERSTNDSNLFNHIVVFGNPNDAGIPYFGEALNTDPASPTRIARIGDRYDDYQFDTVTSDAEAQTLAETFLKVASLETYEMNFSSICYPWLEANKVVGIEDPRALPFEPTKYLMDSLTIPIGLGPMSATGKRITFVGDSG
jgi:hypothetical protein